MLPPQVLTTCYGGPALPFAKDSIRRLIFLFFSYWQIRWSYLLSLNCPLIRWEKMAAIFIDSFLEQVFCHSITYFLPPASTSLVLLFLVQSSEEPISPNESHIHLTIPPRILRSLVSRHIHQVWIFPFQSIFWLTPFNTPHFLTKERQMHLGFFSCIRSFPLPLSPYHVET